MALGENLDASRNIFKKVILLLAHQLLPVKGNNDGNIKESSEPFTDSQILSDTLGFGI